MVDGERWTVSQVRRLADDSLSVGRRGRAKCIVIKNISLVRVNICFEGTLKLLHAGFTRKKAVITFFIRKSVQSCHDLFSSL